MRKYRLSEEEQEILDFFEKNDSFRKPDINEIKKQKDMAKIAAKNFAKKTERINIRMPLYDLNHIKRIAVQEGIPYQTLISSVLHKYAFGYLKLDKAL